MNEMRHVEPYAIVLSIYIGCLVICQVLATKLVTIELPLIGNLTFTGGEVPYALTFLCTDAIAEVWGRRRAATTVACGLIANLIVLLLIRSALLLPTASFWGDDEAFRTILGSTTRITLASIVAFIISQTHDVWLFHLMKNKAKGRHLWLRNNVSTATSQAIDTTIFTVLAFYGTAPVMPLIIGQLTIKWIIAAADTPLAYLAVWALRKHTGNLDLSAAQAH